MRLAVLGGSLRRDSLNLRFLTHLARTLEARGHPVTALTGEALRLPLYDADLPVPEGVAALQAALAGVGGLVLVSPEYNAGVPPHLKNAVDWLSTLSPDPLRGLPVRRVARTAGVAGGPGEPGRHRGAGGHHRADGGPQPRGGRRAAGGEGPGRGPAGAGWLPGVGGTAHLSCPMAQQTPNRVRAQSLGRSSWSGWCVLAQPFLQDPIHFGLPSRACGPEVLNHLVRQPDGDPLLPGSNLRAPWRAQFGLQGGGQSREGDGGLEVILREFTNFPGHISQWFSVCHVSLSPVRSLCGS